MLRNISFEYCFWCRSVDHPTQPPLQSLNIYLIWKLVGNWLETGRKLIISGRVSKDPLWSKMTPWSQRAKSSVSDQFPTGFQIPDCTHPQPNRTQPLDHPCSRQIITDISFPLHIIIFQTRQYARDSSPEVGGSFQIETGRKLGRKLDL